MARTKQTDIGSGLDLLGCEEVGERVRETRAAARHRWRKWARKTRQFAREDVHLGEDTIPTAGANYTDAKTVAAVQAALVKKGYSVGTSGPNGDGVDGIIGSKTKAAIKKMQADAGLPQSGVIDEGVIMALKVTPGVLPPGVTMSGRAAVQAQAALDAATAVEHAATPSDVQKAAQQAADVVAAAAPPPPPDVQEKVSQAVARAKAAKTPAQVAAAAADVKAAAQDLHAAVSPPWYELPMWSGGPPRWQVGVAGGAGALGFGMILWAFARA